MQSSPISAESVRTQLRKILSSSIFARSERLARFLSFAVEQMLEGRGEELKEFVIGVEVFDKTDKYDPRMDPIVRVEARRLREKLRRYYETEGSREMRVKVAAERRAARSFEQLPAGRPSKRDRKRIIQFRGRG